LFEQKDHSLKDGKEKLTIKKRSKNLLTEAEADSIIDQEYFTLKNEMLY